MEFGVPFTRNTDEGGGVAFKARCMKGNGQVSRELRIFFYGDVRAYEDPLCSRDTLSRDTRSVKVVHGNTISFRA